MEAYVPTNKKVYVYKKDVKRCLRASEVEDGYAGIFRQDDNIIFADGLSITSLPIQTIRNRKDFDRKEYDGPPWIVQEIEFLNSEKYVNLRIGLNTSEMENLLFREYIHIVRWDKRRKLYQHECKNENKVHVGDCILDLKLGERTNNCQRCLSNREKDVSEFSSWRDQDLIEKRGFALPKNRDLSRHYRLGSNEFIAQIRKMFDKVDFQIYSTGFQKERFEVDRKYAEEAMEKLQKRKREEGINYFRFVHHFELPFFGNHSKKDLTAEMITIAKFYDPDPK